jgi:hypothetical protein
MVQLHTRSRVLRVRADVEDVPARDLDVGHAAQPASPRGDRLGVPEGAKVKPPAGLSILAARLSGSRSP